MKYWLACFLAILLTICSCLFAVDKLFPHKNIPKLDLFINGEIKTVDTEEFALRVLLAQGENCESFENKKALAVAGRSCGVYISTFGCKHDDFDVCDDKSCCFALVDPLNANEAFLAECVSAVEETKGLCLYNENLPAMALFSLCNGSGSENCTQFPYNTAVGESKACDIHKKEAFADYSVLREAVDCDKDQILNNSLVVYKENRKCEFVILGGKRFEGEDFRNLLNLESNEFVLTFQEDKFKAETIGIGNGFGLSICGGEALAKEGKSFEEIG